VDQAAVTAMAAATPRSAVAAIAATAVSAGPRPVAAVARGTGASDGRVPAIAC